MTRKQHRQAVRQATRIGRKPTRREIRQAYRRYVVMIEMGIVSW